MLQPPDDRNRPPGADARTQSLSPNLRFVGHYMWRMGYGIIRGLPFRNGDPLLDRPFHALRKARLTHEAWPHRQAVLKNVAPKRELIRFQEELAAAGTGIVDIKVVKGLPVDLDIHEQS